MTVEKSASGVHGFLLYCPFINKHIFRVYREDKTFIDYKLCAEDIKVTLESKGLSLYEDEGENRLDWSSKTFKKDT